MKTVIHIFSRVVDGSPECFCPSGWSGDRCHLRQDSNSPLPQPQDPPQDEALLLNVSVAHLEVLVLVLAATSLALLLLVVALAVVIFRLKQRPRIIRKRWERYDYRDHVLSYIITPDVKQTTKMIKETAFDTYIIPPKVHIDNGTSCSNENHLRWGGGQLGVKIHFPKILDSFVHFVSFNFDLAGRCETWYWRLL